MRFAWLFLLLTVPAGASWTYKGEIAAEGRWFEGDGIGQTEDAAFSGAGRLEIKGRQDAFEERLRLFVRADSFDSDRNRFNAEEAYFGWREGGLKIRLGAQILNWSATEAFHPADIVNSRNFDSNVENAEKLGEPMLMVERKLPIGRLSTYIMPYLSAPQLPGGSNRQGFAAPGVEIGDALWAEENGDLSRKAFAPQSAIRLSKNIGPADVGLHLVSHYDRSQPVLLADPTSGKIRPVYLPMIQIGGTYLHVMGPWVFKSELAYRGFDNPDIPTRLGPVSRPDHGQAAFGAEYGWDSLGGAQTTLIVEGQSVLAQDKQTRADLSIFQRDVLVGLRRAFNDAPGQELFLSFIFDAERSDEFLYNAVYSRRLSDTFSAKTGFRIVQAPKKRLVAQGLETLNGSDHFFLTITRHF